MMKGKKFKKNIFLSIILFLRKYKDMVKKKIDEMTKILVKCRKKCINT